MDKETQNNNTGTVPTTPTAPTAPKAADTSPQAQRYGRGGGSGQKDLKKNPRRFGRSEGKPRSEYDQKIISIRRVTRVVAGGRRFSFSVALVAGNKKGSVGVGIGKAGDTSLAIDKALKNAKKNMIKVHLTKDMSIPHEVDAKYASSRVLIMPAPERGLIAGSSIRNVLELAGIKNVNAKLLSGSKNRLNNARVAINALSQISTRNRSRGVK